MSGSYLVCEQCGQFGPPSGFVVRDGVRLCSSCLYAELEAAEPEPAADPDRGLPGTSEESHNHPYPSITENDS
jgi:hypothetical protein